MALDLQKTLLSAERMLKTGKVDSALAELNRLARSGPNDLLALNRIGDLLSRNGRPSEAIRYYTQIAGKFTESGFVPKAIAIHKKVLRLNPDCTASLVSLGELYVKQKLAGEAARFFLAAAERFLQEKAFAEAREVYRRLVDADPANPLHRARLAETMAAEGANEEAAQELVTLGGTLLENGREEEAEKTFRRATELVPDSPGPLAGLSRCLAKQGREEEAFKLLERAAEDRDDVPEVLGELAVGYETAGRAEDAMRVLRREPRIPDDSFKRIFNLHMERSQVEELWVRMDGVFAEWTEGPHGDRLAALLGSLADLEPQGHVPAIERLTKHLESNGDRAGQAQALERLVRAYQVRSMDDQASEALGRLKAVAPKSPLVVRAKAAAPDQAEAPQAQGATVKPAKTKTTKTKVAKAKKSGESAPAEGDLPLQVEAPAVPLNRGDEDFVTGRLTQAEILEKYGLAEKAIEQIREVTEKFPGHTPAQERLVSLLREGRNRKPLQETLVKLALARRASGQVSAAKDAANEAASLVALDPETRRLLARLGLLEGETVEEPPAPVKVSSQDSKAIPLTEVDQEEPSPVAVTVAPKPGKPEAAAVPTDSGVIIDFDAVEEEEEVPAPAVVEPTTEAVTEPEPEPEPPPAAPSERIPSSDMLEEIQLYLERGSPESAQQRIDALRALRYGGAELQRLADQVAALLPAALESEKPAAPEPAAIPELISSNDDDLSAITAALESELFDDMDEPVAPQGAGEQSLEEVFAAFKEHVKEQVGEDDSRTHYDLGIAYKEMGLMDEAINEFETASKSAERFRESCTMLAICHRERQQTDQAAVWYRKAIDAAGDDPEALSALRYELGELLLEAGDRSGALSVFRDVLQSNPAYRDVQHRIAELESHSQTS